MTALTADVVKAVFDRDEGCCAKCGGPITGQRGIDFSFHHRRPRGSGGSKLAWVGLPGNIVMLCGSGTTGCHGRVESFREVAADDGFLVALNGRLRSSEVPILHAVHGLVYLLDDGTVADRLVA